MCNFILRRTQKISRNVSAVLNTRSASNLWPLDPAITVARHQQQISPQNKQVYKVFKSHWGKRSLRDVQINQEWGRPPREREGEGRVSGRYSVMQSSWPEQITCGFITHWESKAWLQSGLKNKLVLWAGISVTSVDFYKVIISHVRSSPGIGQCEPDNLVSQAKGQGVKFSR